MNEKLTYNSRVFDLLLNRIKHLKISYENHHNKFIEKNKYIANWNKTNSKLVASVKHAPIF